MRSICLFSLRQPRQVSLEQRRWDARPCAHRRPASHSPEVDLQRSLFDLLRDVHQHVALRAEIQRTPLQQVLDLFHTAAILWRGGGAQVLLIGKNTHPRHDAIPGKDRIALADRLSADVGGDALARHPEAIELPQRIGQVRVLGVRPPILGIASRIGLIMRDDIVARSFEVVVDALIEPIVRRLAQVARFEKLDEGRGSALEEQKSGRLQRLDEALRQAHCGGSSCSSVS